MGSLAYNQQQRIDTIQYLLVYPQVPMVKTKTIDMINYTKLPAGHNAMVAVMSYSGYDIEDAIVLNRSSIDRGFGRCTVMRKYPVTVKRYSNNAYDQVKAPPMRDESKPPIPGMEKYDCLGLDGFANPGETVSTGAILANKYVPLNVSDSVVGADISAPPDAYKASPVTWKQSYPAVVDKVVVSSNDEDQSVIKIAMRSTRAPELGDKFRFVYTFFSLF